jgi:DNA-binding beta-propeller fold protein YncE
MPTRTTKRPPRRGVIYGRQSRTKEGSESLETQVAACQETAAHHKIEVVGVILEPPSTSAYRNRGRARPRFGEVLDLIRSGAVDCVVAYKTDRLSRGGGIGWAPRGSTFTVGANPSTFACNGAPGATGPAGPAGPTGPQGPAGPGGSSGALTLSPDKLALLQWRTTFAVGSSPIGVAFDGAHMWVGNNGSSDVSELNLDGTPVPGSPFAAGTNPVSIAFDGAHMWVANFGSNNVSELNLNGTPVPGSPFGVGAHPAGIAFDGGTCG